MHILAQYTNFLLVIMNSHLFCYLNEFSLILLFNEFGKAIKFPQLTVYYKDNKWIAYLNKKNIY